MDNGTTLRAWLSARAGTLVPVALLAGVMLCLFFPFWGQGKVFLAADFLYDYYPWAGTPRPDFPSNGPKVFESHPMYRTYFSLAEKAHNPLISDPLLHNWTGGYNRQMKEGWPALWQPDILAGLPATEVTGQTGSPGRYYPLKMVLHRLFPPHVALMLLLMTHVLLMGVTMNLYLREIGADAHGALLGAAAWMLNGSLMVWLEFETIAATGALLPLILLAMERWLGRRRWLWAFVGALALGATTLMGQLQYVLYVGLLMLLYLGFLQVRSWLRGDGWRGAVALAGCFAIAALGGAAIAGVQLLPIADLVDNSARIERTFTFQGIFETLGKVPLRYFVTMAFPYFYGAPSLKFNIIPRLPTQEYMNFNELCITMGIPTLFLILAAAAAAKNAFSRFYLGLALLVGAMLAGTWAYWPLFRFFPGMDRMNPIRISFLFAFALAVTAGLGATALRTLAGRRRIAFLGASGLLLAAIIGVGLLGGTAAAGRWFDAETARTSPAVVLEFARYLRRPASPVILPQMIIACLAAAAVVLWSLASRPAVKRGLFAALFGLLAFEMISFGWGYNSFADAKDLYRPTPAVDFLRSRPGPFRVILNKGGETCYNSLAHFGIQELGGYSSFYPSRTKTFMSSAEYGEMAFRGARFDRWVMFTRGSPSMPLSNGRYLLTSPGGKVEGMMVAYRGQDLAIYEDPAALPRAYAVHRAVVRQGTDALRHLGSPFFDMRREVVLETEPAPAFLAGTAVPAPPPRAEIVRYSADRVEVEAELGANGWLVLADAWYPGWRATVDGREAPIERANYLYRAVALERGTHRVVFDYTAPAFRRGLLLTLVGTLLVGAGIVVAFRRRTKEE